MEAVAAGRDSGIISIHGFAEIYSALSSLPLLPRILPSEAERIIDVNVRPYFRPVAATEMMYRRAIKVCVHQSFGNGKVYDALLLECARKADCERIYTFNLQDFRQLAPDLAERIVAP